MSKQNIKSPCKEKCQRVNGKCIGCGRTIDEITNWVDLTDKQKRLIIQRLQKQGDI